MMPQIPPDKQIYPHPQIGSNVEMETDNVKKTVILIDSKRNPGKWPRILIPPQRL